MYVHVCALRVDIAIVGVDSQARPEIERAAGDIDGETKHEGASL